MSAELDELSEDRPCVGCGKNPAEGYASVWTREGGEKWYCHGDDEPPYSFTCYQAASLPAADTLPVANVSHMFDLRVIPSDPQHDNQ